MTEGTKKRASRIAHRNSRLCGGEILDRLQRIRWSETDFARFCGRSWSSMHDILSGKMDGKISMETQRSLMLAEAFPLEMLTLEEMQTPVYTSESRKFALQHKKWKQTQENESSGSASQHA